MSNPIKPYQKKDGKTYYMLKLYFGMDKETGKQIHITRRGFETKEEAEAALANLRAEAELKDAKVSKKLAGPTYAELYKQWVKKYEETVEESTFVKTTGIFNRHIIPALGEYTVGQIDISTSQNFVNDCSLKMKKFKTVKVYASKVMEFAVEEGYIEFNPFSHVKYPEIKGDTDKKIKYYSEEELAKFLNCLEEYRDTQMTAFFRLLSFTGIHKGEALALKWSDLDLQLQTICVSKALTRGKENKLYVKSTRSGNTRTFLIDDNTCHALSLWKKEQSVKFPHIPDDERLMFSNEQNGPLQQTAPRQWLMKIIEQYKLPYTDIQSFRHTHCSLLIQNGMDINNVQERLGRTDTETTFTIYSNVNENKALQA